MSWRFLLVVVVVVAAAAADKCKFWCPKEVVGSFLRHVQRSCMYHNMYIYIQYTFNTHTRVCWGCYSDHQGDSTFQERRQHSAPVDRATIPSILVF